jgi:hypothetical protein
MQTNETWKDEGLAWGSHLPALLACVAASKGPVLEFGSGNYSTPCLRAVCEVLGRELVTVEKVDSWRAQFEIYQHPLHRVLKLTPGLAESLSQQQWGVVFVDDAADDRHARADLFYNTAEFMVFHDYNFDDMKPGFDKWLAENECHHFVYTLCGPYTLLVSKNREIPTFCPAV